MRLLISGATATLRRHLPSPYLGHLLVPGAGNSVRRMLATGQPWAADNAAFSGFDPGAFAGLLSRIAGKPGCLFVACPDVVGDARATLEQFAVWQPVIASMGLPVALVGQDGLEDLDPPWERMQAFFLGGSTEWKLSDAAASRARAAKARGCWVHMGRCNTLRRLRHAYAIGCDSIDGSAFSRWPGHHIPNALAWLATLHGTAAPARPPEKPALPVARPKATAWLDLPGWIVDHAHRTPAAQVLSARFLPEAVACPGCAVARLHGRGIRRNGTRRQRFRDLPRGGKPVVIEVTRRRYRCLACGLTVLQPLPDMQPGGRLTRRLAAYIARQAMSCSFRSIARELGIDGKTAAATLQPPPQRV
jgi:hypothetical protein